MEKKGIILLNLKKYAECQEPLERAFNLNSKDADICNSLAEFHLIFGDLKNASKYVDSALLIDNEGASSLNLKGKIKIEEQDYATAIMPQL